MNLDVRAPAGWMFLILGALLVVYGLASDPAVYARSLGVNVNLGWGAALIAFGLAMLAWRRYSPAVVPERSGPPPSERPPSVGA